MNTLNFVATDGRLIRVELDEPVRDPAVGTLMRHEPRLFIDGVEKNAEGLTYRYEGDQFVLITPSGEIAERP